MNTAPNAAGLAWIKSSYSNGGGGNCVEVAAPQRDVLVRDSKRPRASNVRFSRAAWNALLTSLKNQR